ncbi:MAG: S8 family peptidase [Brevinematia bacterium]
MRNKLFIILFIGFLASSGISINLSSDVYTFLRIYDFVKETTYYESNLQKLYSFSVGDYRDFVDLLVEFSGDEGDLGKYVLKRFPGRRNFALVRIPVDEVLSITNKVFVKYATVSKKLKPFLDKVRDSLSLDSIYNYYGQDSVQGKDVIIGIVDSGIDASHDDFKTSSGSTRIMYIFDQTTNVSNPEWGYGIEYSKDDINRDNFVSKDYDGHGTHVAGIATGNGRLSNGKYMGISSGSSIIVVKTDFSLGGVLTGIEYIMKRSKNVNKPCVINLSLGVNTGSHDGKDIESKILNELLTYYGKEGNIVVVAGGNSGYGKNHYSNTVSSTPSSAILSVSNFSNSGHVLSDFWLPGGTSFDVKVTTPSGSTSGWITFANGVNFRTNYSGVEVNIVMSSNIYNNDLNVQVLLITSSGGSINGNWQISFKTTTGSVLAHGWVEYSEGMLAWFKDGDDYFTLNSLFLIDDVITVSAYTTKNSFLSAVGNVSVPGLTNDNISYFSSKGPTRDGRQKPDISAPGAVVFAPLSSSSAYDKKYLDAFFGNYVGMMGTSMACPVVSGVSALLLSVNPKFTSSDILNYLRTYSDISVYDQNGKSWDPSWGWGKANVKSIIESLKTPQNLVWFSGNVIRLDNNQNSTFLNFRLSDGNDVVKVDIYDINGNFLKSLGSFSLYEGINKVPLVVDNWFRTGVYFVKISGSKFNQTLKIVVIR